MHLVNQRNVSALRAAKHGQTNSSRYKLVSWVQSREQGRFRHGTTLAPTSLGTVQAGGMPATTPPASFSLLQPVLRTIFSPLFTPRPACFFPLPTWLCPSDLLPLTCCSANERTISSCPLSLLFCQDEVLKGARGGFLWSLSHQRWA